MSQALIFLFCVFLALAVIWKGVELCERLCQRFARYQYLTPTKRCCRECGQQHHQYVERTPFGVLSTWEPTGDIVNPNCKCHNGSLMRRPSH